MPALALRMLLPAVLALGSAGAASAQVALPYVPPEEVREHRWIQGDKVRFCTWSVSPTKALDHRVAEEIGAALLLQVEVYNFTNKVPQDNDNFWEAIFTQLAEHCDAVMGFAMLSDVVPDWLTPTRPYYEGPFVAAVTNPAYAKLGDVPPGSAIGTLLYTTADLRLLQTIDAQPENARWKRFPFTTSRQLIDYLKKGTVEASIFWLPTLIEATGGDPAAAGIKVVRLDPVSAPPTPIGMMLRDHNAFLRNQLDLAIQSLVADGVIDGIVAELGWPDSAGATE